MCEIDSSRVGIRPSTGFTAVWILMVALLVATGSRSLHACDSGTAVPDPDNDPGLVSDCKALLQLRDKLAGTASLNWDAGLAMSSWRGLTISESPRRVTGLNLGHSDLTGVLPPELGQLSRLQYLFLTSNQLAGSIPAELSQLSQLRELGLGRNQLTGPIPAELGQLSELRELILQLNGLTGTIPVELGQLSELQVLAFSHNPLTGPIPVELAQLSKLRILYLAFNGLTGSIPVELSQLSQLELLYLSNNHLTGTIPVELAQLPALRTLALNNNQLTGPIPVELGQLSQLQRLLLNNNELTGPIPVELAQLFHLQRLLLHNNQLTGPIPVELGQLSELRFLLLSHNRLTGPIPVQLAQLFQLRWLWLDHNQLSGMIPRELGNIARLQQLHLQNNQLTGQIPGNLGQLSSLTEFSYRGNQLTGPVPHQLLDLPDVYVRNLAAVRLSTGQIRVTWDDPGDPAAGYEYQLEIDDRIWTQVTPIEDPEAVLRLRGGATIEWILGGLSPDVTYTTIALRVWNRSGADPGAFAAIRALEASEAMDLPFCLSLWEGEPCTTAAVLPHVFMGPLSENDAQAELLITNRDPKPESCDVAVLFHRGVSEAPEVLFDGQVVEANLLHMTVPRGGAQILSLTADSAELVVGAVSVFAQAPCSANSLQVQARYLVEDRMNREIDEVFSVAGQSSREWLGDGDCQVLTGVFGAGRNLGFASVTTDPGLSAPSGTQLHFRAFDLDGNLTGDLPSLEVTGEQSARFPWDLQEPTIVEMCLDVPGADSDFQISTIAIGILQKGNNVQWSDEGFADIIRSRKPSAWSDSGP